MRRLLFSACFAATAFAPLAVKAEPVGYGASLDAAGWETVQFRLISRAEFKPKGQSLSIRTEGNGGLIWRALPEALRETRKAQWSWSATAAVPATDLTVKGGDDRVASVYFLFGAPEDAGKSATQLLRSKTSRAVVYTFGSNVKRGSVLPSPHMGQRGKFVVLRSVADADGKPRSEKVDFGADYRRIFGDEPQTLLGIAISSDSDDTGAVNEVRIGSVDLKP
jgi:hypothetical protein